MILGTNETEGSGNFDIGVGPVVKRGQNLPSNKNLADYIDKKGRMNLLDFFSDHKQRFPTLFKIMQHEASCRAVEVGCERFLVFQDMYYSPVDLHLVFGIMSALLCWQLFCRVCILIQVGWLKSTCADLKQESGKKKTL
jgi:hypothetical protein